MLKYCFKTQFQPTWQCVYITCVIIITAYLFSLIEIGKVEFGVIIASFLNNLLALFEHSSKQIICVRFNLVKLGNGKWALNILIYYQIPCWLYNG